MRYAFIIPLYGAAVIALGMWAGGAHPAAPFAATAMLGASFALIAIRKDVV